MLNLHETSAFGAEGVLVNEAFRLVKCPDF